MEAAHISLRLLASSQVLLFFFMILLSNNPKRVRVVGCTLMLAVVTYFVEPLMLNYLGIERIFLTNVFPSLIPTLTLLFVWTIFEDGNRIPGWMWMILGVDIALSVWVGTLSVADPRIQAASQIIKTAMAVTAIFVVWRGRENDLVAMRAMIRMWFIGAFALTVLAVAIKEFLYIFDMAQPRVIGMAWMFLLSLFGNIAFIKLNPAITLVGEPAPQPSAKPNEDPIIDKLLHRMQSERLYSDHDLRVATLAELIGVPEYQLRKKINQSLGFRNFNQFVNHYRIEEAGERLRKDRRSPVLSIALDVGFRSISSFNSAFQTKYGVSPTVFRSKGLPDS